MTKGIPKKRQRDEQLRKKRAQAVVSGLATGTRKPAPAMPEPLPPAHYPTRRSSLGKPQVAKP
jgi:hypothetical protein